MMLSTRFSCIRVFQNGHTRIKLPDEVIKNNILLNVRTKSSVNRMSKCCVRMVSSVLQNNCNIKSLSTSSGYNNIRPPSGITVLQRNFWGVLNVIFNRYDASRVKAVGPDRACAEWLLRCGAFVKWKDTNRWTKDYNSLPTTGGKKLWKIEEVDATESSVMHVGFKHFNGCKQLRRIIFHKASYLTDEALEDLVVLKDTLKEIQISSCGNISVDGLRHLKKLINLEYINLYDFPRLKDKDSLLQELEEALPNCAIVFPYALAKDDPSAKDEVQ